MSGASMEALLHCKTLAEIMRQNPNIVFLNLWKSYRRKSI